MTVVLYVQAGCAFCDAARAALAARDVRVVEVDVGRERQSIPELLKLTGGRRVVPVIVEGGKIAVAPEGGSEF